MQVVADPQSQMSFQVMPQTNPQASSGGEEMNLTGLYKLQMNTVAQQGLPMVTGLEVGQLQDADPMRPSLILCRPDGESLWDMAKRCGSTVAHIQRANGLSDEPAENRMLLVPIS